jgi:cytochrome c oxidase subunit 3
MERTAVKENGQAQTRRGGWRGFVADWSSDQRSFKDVSWGKAMMWIFLLSDTFVFSCFLISYMTVRMSTVVPWPNPSEVFALTIGGEPVPLILIAIMTFVLISSSGTMAMAVNFAYRKDRVRSAYLMLVTAALGAAFVGMQAFEWSKLIHEGVRPWGNPWGAPQFGSTFFMITGFHGTHVSFGVIFLIIVARKVLRGDYDKGAPGFFTSRRGSTSRSRSWAFTGTSWIWCGFSSSPSFTFGEKDDGTDTCIRRARPLHQALPRHLGIAVRPQCLLLFRGLPSSSR